MGYFGTEAIILAIFSFAFYNLMFIRLGLLYNKKQ